MNLKNNQRERYVNRVGMSFDGCIFWIFDQINALLIIYKSMLCETWVLFKRINFNSHTSYTHHHFVTVYVFYVPTFKTFKHFKQNKKNIFIIIKLCNVVFVKKKLLMDWGKNKPSWYIALNIYFSCEKLRFEYKQL